MALVVYREVSMGYEGLGSRLYDSRPKVYIKLPRVAPVTLHPGAAGPRSALGIY